MRNGKVVADVLAQWARREQTLLKGWGKAMVPINREWTAVLNGQRGLGEAISIAKAEAEAAPQAEAEATPVAEDAAPADAPAETPAAE